MEDETANADSAACAAILLTRQALENKKITAADTTLLRRQIDIERFILFLQTDEPGIHDLSLQSFQTRLNTKDSCQWARAKSWVRRGINASITSIERNSLRRQSVKHQSVTTKCKVAGMPLLKTKCAFKDAVSDCVKREN